MDLWNALGVSPQQGLLAAAGAIVTAFAFAAFVLLRRSRGESKVGLGLDDSRR